MHTILLHPVDILFFKDGRPMSGASSGHGTAWPLPTVTDSAFLACLHRANLANAGSHGHRARAGVSRGKGAGGGLRKFGSFVHAGPFPVCTQGAAPTWFFPRPLDAVPVEKASAPRTTLLPVDCGGGGGSSSLPAPLRYPVGNLLAPSKDGVGAWWSEGAWNAYLGTPPRDPQAAWVLFQNSTDFSDAEHRFGIALEPDTQSVKQGAFYSAHYLRLREGWSLGCFAAVADPSFSDPRHGNDLLQAALAQTEHTLLLGGQQRTAKAELVPRGDAMQLPLPAGKAGDFPQSGGKHRVKWVLLSPALWPSQQAHSSTDEQAAAVPDGAPSGHPGGWLPSWIDHTDGAVQLRQGVPERGPGEAREAWRKRVAQLPPIRARLVAAVVGKAIPVTGFAVANEAAGRQAGAKNTHAAVPAGSVYYFEADSAGDAEQLAAALNWHGAGESRASIRNRRSNLLGEKGFGIGVCAGWDFHGASAPAPQPPGPGRA